MARGLVADGRSHLAAQYPKATPLRFTAGGWHRRASANATILNNIIIYVYNTFNFNFNNMYIINLIWQLKTRFVNY